MNEVTMVGRISKDLVLNVSKNGKEYCIFDIAVEGVAKQVSFFTFICFGITAINLEKYNSKGDLILIKGHLTVNQYEKEDGKKRQKYELIASSISYLAKAEKNKKKEEMPY